MTPLMAAAMTGKPEAIQAVVDGKCRLDARTDDGRTALYFAAGWAARRASRHFWRRGRGPIRAPIWA